MVKDERGDKIFTKFATTTLKACGYKIQKDENKIKVS